MAGRELDVALLVAAVVLLFAIGAVRLSSRFGIPTLLAYLAIGLLLGEDVLGLQFDNASLARDLGLVALALILAEGGLTTRWRNIRDAMPAAITLASLGVGVSIAATAVITCWPCTTSKRSRDRMSRRKPVNVRVRRSLLK